MSTSKWDWRRTAPCVGKAGGVDHPGVEATNNPAERQRRPGVIARKVSCGQRTRRGADAWQVLASLAATCRQRAESFIDLVVSKIACPVR